jgi:Uma2 family endonuclease
MAGNDPVTPAFPGVKLTHDDFVQFPDDGQRHELIDGEHYVTPSPNTKHQRVSLNLTLLIGSWLERVLAVRRGGTRPVVPLECARPTR